MKRYSKICFTEKNNNFLLPWKNPWRQNGKHKNIKNLNSKTHFLANSWPILRMKHKKNYESHKIPISKKKKKTKWLKLLGWEGSGAKARLQYIIRSPAVPLPWLSTSGAKVPSFIWLVSSFWYPVLVPAWPNKSFIWFSENRTDNSSLTWVFRGLYFWICVKVDQFHQFHLMPVTYSITRSLH